VLKLIIVIIFLLCNISSYANQLSALTKSGSLFIEVVGSNNVSCYVNNSNKTISFICNKPISGISKNSLFEEYFSSTSFSKDHSKAIFTLRSGNTFAVKTAGNKNSFKIIGKRAPIIKKQEVVLKNITSNKSVATKIDKLSSNIQTKKKSASKSKPLLGEKIDKHLNKVQTGKTNLISKNPEQAPAHNNSMPAVRISSDENFVSLEFPFGPDVAAAAFSREQYIWLAFDTKTQIDLSSIEKSFSDFKVIQNNDNLVIRFRQNLTGKISSELRDNKWFFKISRNLKIHPSPVITLSEYTNPAALGMSLMIDKASAPIVVMDPDISDKITIVPFAEVGAGVAVRRSLIDFELLQTGQGLAVIHKSDNVKVKLSDRSLEIISPNYVSDLEIPSDVLDTTKNLLEKDISPLGYNAKTLLPYFDGIKYEDKNFLSDRLRLSQQVTKSKSKEELNINRFKILRFYFKHGLLKEAFVYLNVIKGSDKDFFDRNLNLQFLQSVIYVLNHEYMDASKAIDSVRKNPNLDKFFLDEVRLWQNYNFACQGIPVDNLGYVDNTDRFLFVYPEKLQWELALKELNILLYKDRPTEQDLKDGLYIVDNMNNPPWQNAQNLENSLLFFSAKYNILIGETDAAKRYLTKLTKAWSDPENRARAEFELVKILTKQGEIAQGDAILRLEKASTLWRGDELEYSLMLIVADLYKKNKELVKSMRIYDYILKNFSKDSKNLVITTEMVKIFNEIFRPGGYVEILDDFTVVSLFNEFRELTPIGPVGDQIVISVARRLLNLDLLDSAEALLKYQVDYRLRSEEKVSIANNLAFIYIINGKPDKALEVLNQTDKYNYNYREYLERLRIRASALIKQEQYDKALNLISQDKNFEADLLREEIFFKQGKWDSLIPMLENKLMDKLVNKKELMEYEVKDVIKLAIAYALSQKYNKLSYMQKNIQTKNENILAVINYLSYHQKNLNYQDIAGTSGINHFNQFLEIYKKKLF
jgi:hypothetical protein